MWLTLKVGSVVVMTLGYADMTLDQCHELKRVVTANIVAHIDRVIERSPNPNGERLMWNAWKATCEPINTMKDEESQH